MYVYGGILKVASLIFGNKGECAKLEDTSNGSRGLRKWHEIILGKFAPFIFNLSLFCMKLLVPSFVRDILIKYKPESSISAKGK